MILGESNYPDKVIDLIKGEMCNLSLSEVYLNRKKKTIISSFLFMSDNIYNLNTKAMNNVIKYGKVNTDDYEEVTSLNIEEYQKIIPNINLENHSVFVINPKKK